MTCSMTSGLVTRVGTQTTRRLAATTIRNHANFVSSTSFDQRDDFNLDIDVCFCFRMVNLFTLTKISFIGLKAVRETNFCYHL